MLTVSLILFTAAIALSTVAVSIAAYRDVRDRDHRTRPQRTPSVDAPHAERPTLRIWQPPPTPPPRDTTVAATRSVPSPVPDIIVGTRPFPPSTDEHEPPAAA